MGNSVQAIISFYKFVDLTDLIQLRTQLRELTTQYCLKGTILLAKEGINGSIAGLEDDVISFQNAMTKDPRFADLWFKKSEYSGVSFRRMLVKIKKEIITMGLDGRESLKMTGRYLDPLELKRWLDEKRDILLIDTRNDYECEMGSFQTAINPNIKTFGAFPQWVNDHLADKKDQPIVTFCTGGIRCEKATTYMRYQGFKNVYQLRGGILNYFEQLKETEANTTHWQGELVVFDKRKAITPTLEHSNKNICYVCLCEIEASAKFHTTEAGNACEQCQNKMQKFQLVRTERGLLKQQVFNQRRQEWRSKRSAQGHQG